MPPQREAAAAAAPVTEDALNAVAGRADAAIRELLQHEACA